LECEYLARGFSSKLKLTLATEIGGAFLSCDKTVWSVSIEHEVFPQNSHSLSILNLGVLFCRVTTTGAVITAKEAELSEVLFFSVTTTKQRFSFSNIELSEVLFFSVTKT
jgi:hypothetical protein